MRSSLLSALCFVILLCISLGNAQSVYNYPAPERFITNSGSPIVLFAPYFTEAKQTCTQGYITATKDGIENTGCLTVFNGTTETPICDQELVGISELTCLELCLALNPYTRNFIIFDPHGSIITVYGNDTLTDFPQGMTFWSTPGIINSATYDAGYLYMFTFYTGFDFHYGNPMNTLSRNDSSPLAGLAIADNRDVFMAYKGETFYNHMVMYSTFDYYEKGDFMNITVLSQYNDRVHVFDASNKTILIFNKYSTQIGVATTPRDITKLAFSNDYMYAVDDLGVIRYSNKPTISVFQVTDATCASVGGSLYFELANGAVPNRYRVLPDADHKFTMVDDPYIKESFFYGLAVDNIPQLSPNVYNYTIFGDALSFAIALTGDSATFTRAVNSSVIVPHSGNASFEILMNRSVTIGYNSLLMTCAVDRCIDSYRYKAIEFYLNVGNGGQSFSFELDGVQQVLINATNNNLTLNAWNKITIDISKSPFPHTYKIFSVKELASFETPFPRNPIYIDDFILVAYDAQYTFLTYDECGVTQSVPFTIVDKTFRATVTTPTVTCNALGVNGNKSSDAIANATLINGVGPFEYNWNFTGDATANVSLSNLRSRSSVITVYSDGLNSTWTDASRASSINLNDKSRAHSGSSSFSFAPSQDLDLFSFIAPTLMESINYPTIEFWVNGGEFGGQRLSLLIEKQTLHIAQFPFETLLKLNAIPPNVWIKVSYTFPSWPNVKFNKISLQATGDFMQTRIYFDDLVILSRPVLVVYDSTGCAAVVDRMAVNTPPPLVWTQKSHNVKCYNGSDGSISIDIAGGVAPYGYKYSFTTNTSLPLPTGVSTTNSGLTESGITLNVVDSNGCILPPIQYAVLSPPELQVTQSVNPVKCNKKSAVITTFSTGGTGPYTYYWASTAPFFVIPQSSPFSLFADAPSGPVSISNAKVVCAGSGGAQTPRLSYSPSHGGYCSLVPTFMANASSMSLSCETCMPKDKYTGVNLWIYIEKVSDAAKLSLSTNYQNATVQAPKTLSSLANITSGWNEIFFAFVNNSHHDEIVLSSSDPTNMGIILLDDIVAMSSDKDGVGISVSAGFRSVIEGTAGDYFLNVIDANGCSITTKINITEPDALEKSEEIVYPSNGKASDGEVFVNVTGGTPPYTYLWNHTNVTSSELTGITFGTYSLIITDANGCILETTVVVDPSKATYVRDYQKGLSGGLGAIVGIGIAIAIFAAIILGLYWTQFSMLGSFFCACLLVGVMISYVAALTLLPRPTDTLCTAFPWLLGIAFVFVYGCLFIKTWALYQVWRNAKQYKKTALTPLYIMRLIGTLMLIEIVFLIVWTVIDRPTARRVKVVDNSYEIQCATDHPTFWIIFLTVKGAWLVFGGVLSILTRDVVKKYNESSSISYAIYNIIILLAIGVPLATLLKEVPGGRLVIEVVVTVLAFTFTMCIMFFKNWYNIIAQPDISIPTMSKGSTRHSSGGSTHSGDRNSGNGTQSRSAASIKVSNEVEEI